MCSRESYKYGDFFRGGKLFNGFTEGPAHKDNSGMYDLERHLFTFKKYISMAQSLDHYAHEWKWYGEFHACFQNVFLELNDVFMSSAQREKSIFRMNYEAIYEDWLSLCVYAAKKATHKEAHREKKGKETIPDDYNQDYVKVFYNKRQYDGDFILEQKGRLPHWALRRNEKDMKDIPGIYTRLCTLRQKQSERSPDDPASPRQQRSHHVKSRGASVRDEDIRPKPPRRQPPHTGQMRPAQEYLHQDRDERLDTVAGQHMHEHHSRQSNATKDRQSAFKVHETDAEAEQEQRLRARINRGLHQGQPRNLPPQSAYRAYPPPQTQNTYNTRNFPPPPYR
ncbi:hypothetical protein Micbo1qcDRAFT_224877 [Microdochium bolleyi]|uniref:Uncharacterized protein n=1 Tax=Microdochium bolleyi TaxID=196109 RepID=A0A136IJB1_9PEZI|nr:hypothetical protein Micbo1qcDRAFT_224877 [Microdochium bolleyi]